MWWKKATNNLQTLIEHHLILSQTTKDTYPWQKIFLWGLCLLWFSIPLLLAWEKVYHQSKLISPSLWPWNREAKILSTSPLQPEHLRPKRRFRPNFSRQKSTRWRQLQVRKSRAWLAATPLALPLCLRTRRGAPVNSAKAAPPTKQGADPTHHSQRGFAPSFLLPSTSLQVKEGFFLCFSRN